MAAPKKHLCSKVPTTIYHNAMFLVDTAVLDDPRDLDCDDMGVWYNNRVDTVNVAVSKDSSTVMQATKVQRSANKPESYTLKRVYRVHGTDKSLRKLTVSIFGKYNFGMCITIVIILFIAR